MPFVIVKRTMRRRVKRFEHVGEVAAGLLVLPRAGEEHRHLDAVDELVRRDRVGALARRVELVRLDVVGKLVVLAAQRLVGGAGLVAPVDAASRPTACPPGSASAWRSAAHVDAKPVLKMPPG